MSEILSTQDSTRVIPLELEDTLFFMYFSGLSYSDIAKQYTNTETPFSGQQLKQFSYKRKWNSRKQEIMNGISKDFDEIFKHSKAKRVSAITMAVDTVSEMIIKDVVDFRENPKNFWEQVKNKIRPKPFWMAKNVDDLVNLFKLQSMLEGRDEEGDDSLDKFDSNQKNKLLNVLVELRHSQMPEAKPELIENYNDKIVDAEVTVIEEDKNGKTDKE